MSLPSNFRVGTLDLEQGPMKKLLIPIFFALTTLWPVTSQAITQTTSFTLSVTIPQMAGQSANVPVPVSSDEPSTQTSALQTDEVIRNNQVVLLESYVTK
jgi:hypothetical protein